MGMRKIASTICFHKNYYIKRYSKKIIIPSALVFDITYRCNQRCLFCSIYEFDDQSKSELSADEIIAFLERYAQQVHRKPYISIAGGEPLLKDGIIEILTALDRFGYRWGIVTNGSVHDEDIIQTLMQSRAEVIRISLDGMQGMHEYLRNQRDSFNSAVSFIKKVKQGNKRVRIVYIINALNTKDILSVCRLAHTLHCEINLSLMSFVTPAEQEIGEEEVRRLRREVARPTIIAQKAAALTQVDIRSLNSILKRAKKMMNGQKVIVTPSLSEDGLHDYFYSKNNDGPCGKCYFPWFNARINPYGDVFPCRVANFLCGNILKDDLVHVYNNDNVQAFRQRIDNKRFTFCARCAYLSGRINVNTLYDRIQNKYF